MSPLRWVWRGGAVALLASVLASDPARGQTSSRPARDAPTAAPAAPDAVAFPSCGRPVGRGPHAPGPVHAVHVPMSDGVRLALDVVLPAGLPAGTRVPTVLTMTRYWRGEAGAGPTQEARFWASHGYAAVIGDVRGTGASFGVWPHHRSRAETRDFGGVIDWITRQPWSDGQVAGWGTSYSANTADWMAERNHPALRAVVARFPDDDPYADLYFPGGVPNAYMGRQWGLRVKALDLNSPPVAPAAAARGEQSVREARPRGVRPVDGDSGARLVAEAVAARRTVPSVWEGLQQVTYRDDRPRGWGGASIDDWSIRAHRAAVARSGVPIQSWGSWMDAGTAAGVLRRFVELPNPQRVFVGAWGHGGSPNASPYAPAGTGERPPFASQVVEDLCFLAQHLGGRAAPIAPDTLPPKRLAYYTMGEERWKTATAWPPPGVQPERWYLAAGGQLAPVRPSGPAGADRYAVDFAATTGTRNRWATNNGGGAVDYGDRRAADRRLLTYTSAPLARDLELTGEPAVTFHIASTHADGAFFVYLEDVAPDGTVRYVTEGQLRAVHRRAPAPTLPNGMPPGKVSGPAPHTFRRADGRPLVPGKVTALRLALMPVSVLLRAGHRVRLAIAGADADTFRRIPSTGNPVITVHRSAAHPSHVVLPLVPR